MCLKATRQVWGIIAKSGVLRESVRTMTAVMMWRSKARKIKKLKRDTDPEVGQREECDEAPATLSHG